MKLKIIQNLMSSINDVTISSPFWDHWDQLIIKAGPSSASLNSLINFTLLISVTLFLFQQNDAASTLFVNILFLYKCLRAELWLAFYDLTKSYKLKQSTFSDPVRLAGVPDQ